MDAVVEEHPALCGCADCDARFEQVLVLAASEPDALYEHHCAPQAVTVEVLRARAGINHHDIAGEYEARLIERYQGGDKHAGEILLRAHAKLISFYATKYSSGIKHDLSPEDVLSNAQLGFLKAAAKFERGRGTKLVTYGEHWIRSAVRGAIIETGKTIRVPSYHYERRKPGRARKFEREALMASGGIVSLNAPIEEGEKYSLADRIEDTSPLVDEQLTLMREEKLLDGIIDRAGLSEIERTIVDQRVFADEPKTLQAIGDSLNLSRERVRQLEVRAIGKLRTAYGRLDRKEEKPHVAPSTEAVEMAEPHVPPAEHVPAQRLCARCGHKGHNTKTCERWAGRKFGTWTVVRVGERETQKAGGTMTTLVLRCDACEAQTTARAVNLEARGLPPCECASKPKPPPEPVPEPKKLPVMLDVSTLASSEPVPVDRITNHTDRFRCVPYEAVLFANACVKRQEMHAQERTSRVLEYSKCKGCRTGEEVRKRLGVDVTS